MTDPRLDPHHADTPTRAVKARLTVLALGALLATGACGSAGSAPDTPAAGEAAADESTETLALPAISVIDVSSGQGVLLTDLAADPRPTLLWMWAPH